MPRTCTICRHERCQEIDRALVAGESYRHIAARYDTSTGTLQRHKEHLPGKLVKAHEAREVAQADSLLDQVRHLTNEAREILGNVKATQPGTAVQAVRAALHALELQAKILGEIRAAQVNVGVAVGVPEKVLITVRHVDTKGEILTETVREVPRETVYPPTSLPRSVNAPGSWNGTGP